MCKMLRTSDKSLAELAEGIIEYPSKLVNLPVSAKPDLAALPKLSQCLAEADDLFGTEGRYLVRYSGTEDKVRILVEHRSEMVMQEWIGILSKTIREEIG